MNYIRTSVKYGVATPSDVDLSSSAVFDDEKYLRPVLEDDAFLFGLDEVLELAGAHRDGDHTTTELNGAGTEQAITPAEAARNEDKQRIAGLEGQLARLAMDFSNYRGMAARTLDQRWVNDPTQAFAESSTTPIGVANGVGRTMTNGPQITPGASRRSIITHASQPPSTDPYFDSYTQPTVHETMLKDRTRTNAYHHFIHGHKSLFTNATVLDVGCGTGILSFFCARAGAKQVHAVDNSAIIVRAREIAATNNLGDVVRFHRGKVEDLHATAPEVNVLAGKVDVLVSEWMGYALLYEAMLDSVIAARDLYLRPPVSLQQPETAGLMVPSHCTLHLAPACDPDYIDDTVTFWKDVYGFDYSPMLSTPDFHSDAVVRDIPSRTLCAKTYLLKTFALQSVNISDLDFSVPFNFSVDRDIKSLDGFALWFDAFFLPPPGNVRKELPGDVDGARWRGPGVAFTTGPYGKEMTHWQTVWLGIDRNTENVGGSKGTMQAKPLSAGTRVEGTLGYRKRTGGEDIGEDEEQARKRELEIHAKWRVLVDEDVVERGKQTWLLR